MKPHMKKIKRKSPTKKERKNIVKIIKIVKILIAKAPNILILNSGLVGNTFI